MGESIASATDVFIGQLVLFLLLNIQFNEQKALPLDDDLRQLNGEESSFYSYECKQWIASQLWLDSEARDSQTPVDIFNKLPPVSIIITFYNEPEDLLKTTVRLILQRSPRHLLHEILLVDDASDVPVDVLWLSEHKDKVHLIKNPNRVGLMVSRMNGARRARSSVLVFLDSHVEVDPGWLPALLARLVHAKHWRFQNGGINSSSETKCHQTAELSERIVVSPSVYDIMASDEAYGVATHPPVYTGGFTWNLTFRWEAATSPDRWVTPRRTPVISGGLFAVWRDAFFAMGGYDEEMQIWGGENVEFSLRTWMCGGQMEIIPCSRVGHLFRKAHPYTFPNGKEVTTVRNNKRAVLVWFLHRPTGDVAGEDSLRSTEYLARFYTTCPLARRVTAGSVKQRQALASQLHCHSFSWFLDCVYPKLKQEAKHILVDYSVESLAQLEVDSQRGE